MTTQADALRMADEIHMLANYHRGVRNFEDAKTLYRAAAMLREYAEGVDRWRPIDTAPHDDYVIVHAPTGNPVTIKGVSEAIFSYEEDGRQWWRTRDGVLVFNPQRWMPMPSSPPLTAALSGREGDKGG